VGIGSPFKFIVHISYVVIIAIVYNGGDALNALHSLAELPEFAREYLGKVKLAYLDPPFNTQQSFLHYDDALEHSVWLTMLRDRLLQVKALLSDDGSVWVHCDDSEMAYLKVAMDEIFGRKANTG